MTPLHCAGCDEPLIADLANYCGACMTNADLSEKSAYDLLGKMKTENDALWLVVNAYEALNDAPGGSAAERFIRPQLKAVLAALAPFKKGK